MMNEIVLKRKLLEATNGLVKAREFDHTHIACVAQALANLVNAVSEEPVVICFVPCVKASPIDPAGAMK